MNRNDKEIANAVDTLRFYMDTVLDVSDKNLIHFYCTGGSVRRLYMLENDIPMNLKDWDNMWVSDIDVHSKYDHSNNFDIMFDSFGLNEININEYITNPKHNMKVQRINVEFGMPFEISIGINNRTTRGKRPSGLNHDISSAWSSAENTAERFIEENLLPEHITLPFDIDSCKFIYYNGKVYNLREVDSSNFFDDYVDIEKPSIRSLTRLMKYESYGFKYSEKNIMDYFKHIEPDLGNGYGHTETTRVILNKLRGIND